MNSEFAKSWCNRLFYKTLFLVVLLSAAFSAIAGGLSDKNIALLGDSNTWIGGEDCTNEKGWNYWFAKEVSPLSIKSYARSGATWTHTDSTRPDVDEYSEVLTDNNVIFNQVLRLFADVDLNGAPTPDIIVIAAGTNDAWFAHRRPEEFSVTAEGAFGREDEEFRMALPSAFRSLAESVRYDLIYTRSFFPQARIVVLTPIPSVKISGEMLEKVSDIISTVAGRMDAQVVRMDRLSPIIPANETVSRRYTTDGTHTSAEGAKRHGQIVVRALTEVQLDKE